MKTTRSCFCMYSRGEMSIFKSRNNRGKSPFSPFSFYMTHYFCKRHDMIQCTNFKNVFLNACNLGHSNASAVASSSNHPAVNNYLQYNKDQVKSLAFMNTY